MTTTLCARCTVPTIGSRLCTFCRNYVPPTRTPEPGDHLHAATVAIDGIRHNLNDVIRGLPEDVPMFALVDIVNALWNLRNAAVLLDKATDALEADTKAVQ